MVESLRKPNEEESPTRLERMTKLAVIKSMEQLYLGTAARYELKAQEFRGYAAEIARRVATVEEQLNQLPVEEGENE